MTRLKASEKRSTQQRRLLEQVIEEAARPLGPQEIVKLTEERGEPVSIATVYRNLKRLTAEGWLVPVDLPGESVRYERAGRGHHHHFRCQDCARVFDVPGCVADLARHLPDGFEMLDHEVVLYGRCAECTA